MWLLVSVPLLFGLGGYPEPVARFDNKEECEKWAEAWNAELEQAQRVYYRDFACWHTTHNLLRNGERR